MGAPSGGRAEAGPVLLGWAEPGTLEPPARLGPADARRVAEFTAARRSAFLTGRALLALLLAERLGPGGLVDTAPCPHCGGDHGPVLVRAVPGIAGVAYTEGLIVAAVVPDDQARRVGVDAEAVVPDPVRDADLARLLGVAPPRALRRWTEVEAVLKASGRGLRTDPGLVRVDAGTARVEDEAETYLLRRPVGPAGFLISVAWQPPQ